MKVWHISKIEVGNEVYDFSHRDLIDVLNWLITIL